MAASNPTKKPLTALAVKNLKEGILGDIHPYSGLRIRVNTSGSKTWFYRYRSPVDSKVRQVKLGSYPKMSLVEAREALLDLKKEREQGKDLKEERQIKKLKAQQEAQEALRKEFTVSDLVELYMTTHVERKRKPKGQAEVRRVLGRNVVDHIGEMKASDVTRSIVHDLKEQVVTRGAPVIAGVMVRELRQAYEKAINAGRLSDDFPNPCLRVDAPSNGKRDRYLNDGEVGAWLRWLPSASVSRSVNDALLLVLYTGCRSGEVVAAKWKDIDLDAGVLHLQETKTGVPRNVQLSRQAIELLEARQSLSQSDYVFPLPNNSRKPILQKALSLQTSKAQKDDSCPVSDWVPHDIRRTVRTGLSRLRCPNDIGEAVLGHSRKGVQGVYDLHEREDECREWLQRWCDHVEALCASGNVVSLGVKHG